MGLDIHAYSNLTPVTGYELNEDGELINIETGQYAYEEETENVTSFYVNSNYNDLNRQDAIVADTAYAYDEHMHFRAGSYFGYNDWRDSLHEMVKDIEDNPFSELIYFSDCEGVLGPKICAKLYQDFLKYDSKAKELDEYFYDRYKCWTEAMKLASNNGAVKFS